MCLTHDAGIKSNRYQLTCLNNIEARRNMKMPATRRVSGVGVTHGSLSYTNAQSRE